MLNPGEYTSSNAFLAGEKEVLTAGAVQNRH